MSKILACIQNFKYDDSVMVFVVWGVTVEEIGIDVNSGGTWGLKRYTKLSGR